MRHRSVRRYVALLLTLFVVAAFAPLTPAFAAPAVARSARALGFKTLGTDIGTATGLPASPVTGELDSEGTVDDTDDVYYVDLVAGQVLTVSLTGDPGTDFGVGIYRPGSVSIFDDMPFDISWYGDPDGDGVGYPQQLRFVCGTTGRHYLDVVAFSGAGAYTLTYSHPDAPVDMDRLAGVDRYQTAMKISAEGWAAGTSQRMVLATGANFADALAASALAGSYGCPILLTPRTYLPTGLLTEVDRLRGGSNATVMIVGSGSAVDTAVADELDARTGVDVVRFAGPDRYATAVEIGKEVRRHEVDDLHNTPSSAAFVCLGTNFPDALAISPFAARMKMPVLLVKTTSVPPVTQSGLSQLGITKAYVVGGTGTISQPTMDSLGVATRERLYGDNRYATAASVAQYAIDHGWAGDTTAGIATGQKFPDALGGGALFGKLGGVLLLSEPEQISDPAFDFVAGHAGTLAKMRVLGSHSTLSDWLFADFLDAWEFGRP